MDDLPPLPAARIASVPSIRSASDIVAQPLAHAGHIIPATRPRLSHLTSAASASVFSLSSGVNGVSIIGYSPRSGQPQHPHTLQKSPSVQSVLSGSIAHRHSLLLRIDLVVHGPTRRQDRRSVSRQRSPTLSPGTSPKLY